MARGKERGNQLVFAVVNVEGKAAVCGMYLIDGVVPHSTLKQMLARGEIRSGDKVLARILS
jgi:hypothetical protein